MTLAFALWLVLGFTGVGLVGFPEDFPSSGPPPVDAAPEGAAADRAQDPEREARLERALAERAESLLAHVVGAGQVVVRVRAELDQAAREETRETYDPDGQVERSEERTSGGPAAAGSAGSGSSRRVEYDVSKQILREVIPAGAVKRLHVAVLLDEGVVGAPGSPGIRGMSAELASLEALAKQAVGFSAARGDEFTITSAPFVGASGFGPVTPGLLAEGLLYGLLAAALVAAGTFLVRAWRPGSLVSGLPMTAAELEAALLLQEAGPGAAGMLHAPESVVDEIVRVLEPGGDRDAGAATLRAWLSDR